MDELIKDINAARFEYSGEPLDEGSVDPDPFRQLKGWLAHAVASEVPDPVAMTLATVDRSGQPGARIVLLKGCYEDGLAFYTNYRGKKAADIEQNSKVSLSFFWYEVHRQIRVEGVAEKIPERQSLAYYSMRPRESQLAAWASPQSEYVDSREELENLFSQFEKQFAGGDVPMPPHWGGYTVKPSRWEFWQGRPNRMHDRVEYKSDGHDGWTISRLAP